MVNKIQAALRLVSAHNRAYKHWVKQFIELPRLPFQYVIEPTNYCNMKCLKCPHGHGFDREKGYMDIDLYKNVLDQIADSAINLYFMFGGESFLHKQLFEMIRLAKEKGIPRTFLATNGTLLKEKFDELFASGLDNLVISFDGDNKETNQKLQKGGDFDKMLDGTLSLLRQKQKRRVAKPFISVKVIISLKEQKSEIRPEFSKNFDGLPVNRLYTEVLTLQGKYAKNLLDDERFDSLLKEVIQKKNKNDYFPCFNIFHELVIAWDGTVIGCCRDLEGINVLGNVKEKTVSKIWNDEAFKDLRNRLIEGKYSGPCSLCSSLWLGRPKYITSALFEYLTFSKYVIRDNYPNFTKWLFSNKLINNCHISKLSNSLVTNVKCLLTRR